MADAKHHKRLLLYGVITLLIMLFIFFMSAQDGEKSSLMSHSVLVSVIGRLVERVFPKLTGGGAESDIRKYAHMFEFFCLGISAFLFFRELLVKNPRRLLYGSAAALGFSFLYACTDEWHQTFVPGRAGLFSDVLIDTAGCLIGIVLICLLKAASSLDKKGRTG